jgi:hypothetical protein
MAGVLSHNVTLASITRRHDLGDEDLDDLFPLVSCLASKRDDTAVRPGARGRQLQDFAMDLQDITGADGFQPRELAS